MRTSHRGLTYFLLATAVAGVMVADQPRAASPDPAAAPVLAATTVAAARPAADPDPAGVPAGAAARGASVVRDPVVLAIHGGAGSAVPAETAEQYRAAMRASLEAGRQRLAGGGSSLDAVEAAIRVLEDSPLFNAGKGAVFTTDAGHELDASVMNGKDLTAGAVTGVQHIRNPITLARRVMEASPHVMLAGQGAELFAMRQGIPTVPQDYFHTDRRWQQLLEAKQADPGRDDLQFGTVGAVARDRVGNLAAGTSTGGLTNKLVGRIGDSPIIGAGTYANNRTVAVSATGRGESFIRAAAAHDISALMAYGGLPVDRAARVVVEERVAETDGTGGVIALDRHGRLAAPHTTPALIHGYVTARGRVVIDLGG
jgi:beta-aspartyl-peptidase (threonine type)